MRILILGVYGMLGHALFRVLRDSFETYGTCRFIRGDSLHGRLVGTTNLVEKVTAENMESVMGAVNRIRPDVVVNAIGLIKQRAEARDAEPCIYVNALFPHLLAKVCSGRGIRLIHFSTDCVFSGKRGGYAESDFADADDLYGRSKYLGELRRPNCLTIRCSFIGRELGTRYGLLEWFIGTGERPVRGYTRVRFNGVTTGTMGEILRRLISDHADVQGIRQISGESISKFELLRQLDRALGLGREIVPEPEPACDRTLDGNAFRTETGIDIPSWERMLAGLSAESGLYDRSPG